MTINSNIPPVRDAAGLIEALRAQGLNISLAFMDAQTNEIFIDPGAGKPPRRSSL